MNCGIRGRVALITGRSRGIGKASAVALAKEGAHVIITGRDKSKLRIVKQEIIKEIGLGITIHSVQVDFMDSVQIEKLFSFIYSTYGSLDILVNNVGGALRFRHFDELTDEMWRETLDFNLMSMVRVTRIAIPLLKKSTQPRIINISSNVGRQPGVMNPDYGAAKAGMIYLNKYLSNDLGKYGITVNVVTLSTVEGDAWDRSVENMSGYKGVDAENAEKLFLEEVVSKMVLKKPGKPEDIANLVVFLASKQARFITGTCIAVDGGTIKSMF